MTFYIPVLYICMNLQCGFFQSETATQNEQSCLQEVQQKKIEYANATKIEGVCIDITIERKSNEPISKLLYTRTF